MQPAITDEQAQLRDAAGRFFDARHPLTRARQALPWTDERQRTLWRDMAALGWLGVLAPEAQGGLALGLQEACLIAGQAGRRLLNLPYAASAVLLPLLLRHAHGPVPWLEEIVARICRGDHAASVRVDALAPAEFAGQCGTQLVLVGQGADRWALGFAEPPAGPRAGLDPTLRVADAVPAHDALALPLDPRAMECCLAGWRLARCAELLGAAGAALDLACDYARERRQFGQPIGSYQAVKHRLADAWVRLDDAQLALWHAARSLDAPAAADTEDGAWRFAAHAAQVLCVEGAVQTAQDAIQVHGALGFTWEHDAHLYLKRIRHVGALLGGAEAGLEALEALEPL